MLIKQKTSNDFFASIWVFPLFILMKQYFALLFEFDCGLFSSIRCWGCSCNWFWLCCCCVPLVAPELPRLSFLVMSQRLSSDAPYLAVGNSCSSMVGNVFTWLFSWFMNKSVFSLISFSVFCMVCCSWLRSILDFSWLTKLRRPLNSSWTLFCFYMLSISKNNYDLCNMLGLAGYF